MGINDFNSSDESLDLSSPRLSESTSEQAQERAKKAQIQLKKIQKDEKLAKGDNEKLFLILSRFIQDPYYESLIPDISALLSTSLPSRGIIAFIALFYPDATFYVLDTINKKEKLTLLLSLSKNEQLVEFDEKTVSPEIKKWMSEWIMSSETFLIHPDSSILMKKKFLQIISFEHTVLIERILTNIIIFFFKTRNIHISNEIALNYSRFILKNIINNLRKFLQTQSQLEQELIADIEVSTDSLFGQ